MENQFNEHTNIIFKYIARHACINHNPMRQGYTGTLHSSHHYQICNSHSKIRYACPKCSIYSFNLQHIYKCLQCGNKYCFLHFMEHQHDTVHYWIKKMLCIYHPTTKCKQYYTLSHPINECADSISFRSDIYVIGGDLTNEVYKIDIIHSALTPQEPMLNPKFNISLCKEKAYIYSIGGYKKVFSLSNCEKYSVKENKWYKLPNLVQSRMSCAAFFWHHTLYAFCGYNFPNTFSPINSLEKLNKDKWEIIEVRKAPSKRQYLVGIAVNDGVIVFGG